MPKWKIEPLIRGDDSDEEDAKLRWEKNLNIRKLEPHPEKNRGYRDTYYYKNLDEDFILSITIEKWSQAGIFLRLTFSNEASYQKFGGVLQEARIPIPAGNQPMDCQCVEVAGWRNEDVPERYNHALGINQFEKVTTQQLSQILGLIAKICPFSNEMIDDIGNYCLPKDDVTAYLTKEPLSLKEKCVNYIAENHHTFFNQPEDINRLPQDLQEEIKSRLEHEAEAPEPAEKEEQSQIIVHDL